MKRDIVQIMEDHVSKRRLYQNVKEVSSFHRIQASSGYRKAAKHIDAYLEECGISHRILSYPANKREYAGTHKLFQEWDCKNAYCEMVYPYKKRLADFKLEPISIIQKSYPCDYRKTSLDVVEINGETYKDDFANVDLKGKLLFIHRHFETYYEWGIKEKGALGFISDFYHEVEHVRTREEMRDSLNYTSFWWKHTEDEVPCFGFVLSPRNGDELKAICRDTKRKYEMGECDVCYPQVHAYVDSSLYDGSLEVVEATIPGEKEDAVLMIAHLCHPCSSANDNASGVSGGLESFRVLHDLIKQGELNKPRYTMKLILVPEFSGTYCYMMKQKDRPNILCGINLDMIGGRQVDGYGPITVTSLPHAMPSFVDTLANYLRGEIKEKTNNHEELLVSLTNSTDHKFQLGSDHSVLCDPLMNAPCIMLGQWPDKNYHTSTDTLEVIDPSVLKYSTILAAAYLYTLADLRMEDVENIMYQLRLEFMKQANDIMLNGEANIKGAALLKLKEYYQDSVRDVSRFDLHVCEDWLNHQIMNFDALYDVYHRDINIKDIDKPLAMEDMRIYQRLFDSSIVDVMDLLVYDKDLQKQYQDYEKNHPMMMEGYGLALRLCDYYIDGHRNAGEIAKCVSCEIGKDVSDDIIEYLKMMEQIGLLKQTE